MVSGRSFSGGQHGSTSACISGNALLFDIGLF
jgi:hypothetical protein